MDNKIVLPEIVDAIGTLEMASAAFYSGNKEDTGPLICEALRALRAICKSQGENNE